MKKKRMFTSKLLAEKIGVNRITLWHYEKGEKLPRMETLNRICHVLNINPDYIMGFSDKIRRPRKTKKKK